MTTMVSVTDTPWQHYWQSHRYACYANSRWFVRLLALFSCRELLGHIRKLCKNKKNTKCRSPWESTRLLTEFGNDDKLRNLKHAGHLNSTASHKRLEEIVLQAFIIPHSYEMDGNTRTMFSFLLFLGTQPDVVSWWSCQGFCFHCTLQRQHEEYCL